jgi:diguanylate cyclase (GGDEF)-like protein
MTADLPRTDPTTPEPPRRPRLLDRTSLLFRMGLMSGVFAAGILAFFLIAHEAIDLELPAPDRPVQLANAQQNAPDAKRPDDKLHAEQAKVTAEAARDRADRMIAWGAALIVGVGALLALAITSSIRRSVDDVSAVARALAKGDLEVRYDKATSHDIGLIGASLNSMAQSLTQTLERMRADAERERFSKEVTEAFELAESERAVAAVAARAMQAISPDQPMELLLADAGAAELTRVAMHPTAGSPGCSVHTPSSCVAVRRGSPVTYENSEQLNACPYLRGRQSAPLAATCVPLSFIGKSLGVLHMTGPSGVPFREIVVANLETLALAAATRIGTVRAFQRTQLQAMTDSLTGLLNRRALEIELHDLIRRGGEFAVIVADLDHFKRMNDTLGHQSGDQALRRFGDVLKASLRADDRAARWGGEEFVVLLVGTLALQAAEWVDRARARLAGELAQNGQPAFTASFGIADSSMGRDSATLLRIADSALYIAKSRGRDRGSIGRPEFALEPDRRPRDIAELASGGDKTRSLTIARR